MALVSAGQIAMVTPSRSSQLSLPSSVAPRFPFITQRPTEDGCGAYVLQMLTGKPLSELEALIGWQPGELRRSEWPDLIRLLGAFDWDFGTVQTVASWADVDGVAIVHVAEDHFMLYDADNAMFYDPWEWEGPALSSNRVPLSCLSVRPPSADRAA